MRYCICTKKNGLAERRWKIIVTIKDLLLINSGLLLKFWAEVMETTNYLRNRLLTKIKEQGEIIPEEA